MSDYSVEFSADEVKKLKRIALLLHASAGQNSEYMELAQWLTISLEDDEEKVDDDAPKKKSKRKK